MSIERLSSEIKKFDFTLIDSSKIGYGYRQNQKSEELIRQKSYSFPADDLLELNEQELFGLSRNIRIAFEDVASKSRMRVKRKDLRQLEPRRFNTLVHETEILD